MNTGFKQLFLLFAIFLFAGAAAAASQAQRPALQVHQGHYFKYSMPKGWTANETTNGVDMVAPDQVTGASFALLVGGFGQASPEQFLQMVLSSTPDFQSPQIHGTSPLPPFPGVMGLQWQVIEAEMSFVYRGKPARAHATVGILQGWGQYSAFIRSYQSAAANWEQARYWLPAVAETVVITNPRQVAGVDQVVLPGPISHDYIYGDYNRAWEARNQSNDRLSRDHSEATLGYERTLDPATGQYYDMPYEAYDPTRGGYRNPVRPDEILERAPLGE
jgi:hypothetical protein